MEVLRSVPLLHYFKWFLYKMSLTESSLIMCYSFLFPSSLQEELRSVRAAASLDEPEVRFVA